MDASDWHRENVTKKTLGGLRVKPDLISTFRLFEDLNIVLLNIMSMTSYLHYISRYEPFLSRYDPK